MKPNIFILTIDSFRADKFHGPTKTSKTPNIDNLIKKGAYFEQMIVSADATDPSLGCIFTGKYPFMTGISLYDNHQKASRLFDVLADHGYSRHCTIPDKSFFKTLTRQFEDHDTYSVDPYILLDQGTGKQIIDKLESKMQEPWVYYVHLMDLHPTGGKFVFSPMFDSEQYGSSTYERTVSSIDMWIGKILEKINLDNTILILTADHGDYIPITGKKISEIKTTQNVFRKIKHLTPQLEPLGLKLFLFIQKLAIKFRKRKLAKTLDEYGLRTLGKRTDGGLYDEIVNVPLLVAGGPIKTAQIISQQVRSVDIFPTILDLVEKNLEDVIDGKSLLPTLAGNSEKLPVYIESASTDPNTPGLVVGIRTSKYKYFRSRNRQDGKTFLFDLQNDPLEKSNIASSNQEIVKDMEEILQSLLAKSPQQAKDSLKKLIAKKKANLSLQE